jgi:hypothetical protein
MRLFRCFATSSSLFALACLAVGSMPLGAVADVIDGREYSWHIVGKLPSNPQKEVPINILPNTEDAAYRALAQMEHDYYDDNGSQRSDPNKPIKGTLRVVAWDVAAGRYVEPPPRARQKESGNTRQDPPANPPPPLSGPKSPLPTSSRYRVKVFRRALENGQHPMEIYRYFGNDEKKAQDLYDLYKNDPAYIVTQSGLPRPREKAAPYNPPNIKPGGPNFSPSPSPGPTPAPDQAQFDSKVIGTWTTTNGQNRYTFEFRGDNTFSVGIKNPYFYQRKNGTWTNIGGQMKASYVNSGAPGTGGFSQGRAIQARWSGNNLIFDDMMLRKD